MPSRRRFLTALGTAGVTGLGGCSSSGESVFSPGTDAETEWPMPAYDRGFTAYNPDAAAPRDGATERWSAEVPPVTGRPVVAAGTVLVPTASALVALDVDTGEERWRHGGEHTQPGAVVVHDGTAYGAFADRHGVVALDVETGDRQWLVETTGDVEATPTFDYDRDHLYAGDDTGRVYQIDPENGEVTLRGEVFGPVTALAHFTSLLVGTQSAEVYNLFPDHGEFTGVWRRRVAGAVAALSASDYGVYVAAWGGPVYRLHDGLRAGSSRWEAEAGAVGGLAVASRDVVGCDLAGLRTFDDGTGDVGWEREGEFTAAPAIAGDTVYVGGDREGEDGHGFVAAYALSGGTGFGPLGTGRKRWQFDVEGASAVREGIAVADGAVFAVTRGLEGPPPRVYALDPA